MLTLKVSNHTSPFRVLGVIHVDTHHGPFSSIPGRVYNWMSVVGPIQKKGSSTRYVLFLQGGKNRAHRREDRRHSTRSGDASLRRSHRLHDSKFGSILWSIPSDFIKDRGRSQQGTPVAAPGTFFQGASGLEIRGGQFTETQGDLIININRTSVRASR